VSTGADSRVRRSGPPGLWMLLDAERNVLSLWVLAGLLIASGLVCRAAGAGIAALWLFVGAAVVVALVLPFAYALVSPLFMGIFGWLVDMLPFVVLAGWAAVILRWAFSLLRERRLPRGGRWIWLPIGLLAWTAFSVAVNLVVQSGSDIKHFLLLLGIQLLASGTVLAVVDALPALEDRVTVVAGLLIYLIVLTLAVSLQWVGVPVESLQDETVGERVEEAYGVDAFVNNIGMIKYARAKNAGVGEWRRDLRTLQAATPGLPTFEIFLPKFHVYDEYVLVRFEGSARPYEAQLADQDVDLLFDNVGLAPANLVPRWRSFPRNALTYAGVSAAMFPFALFLAWTQKDKLRMLGRIGAFVCLMGAGFALARGAWGAILIGIIYLFIDGVLHKRERIQALGAFVLAAIALTAVFLVLYSSDPLTARAGAESSVITRQELYDDTIDSVNTPLHFVMGYGTELPRTETGNTRAFGDYGRYVPRAGTHSTYLNYLFRTGVVGAGAVIALYAVAALHPRAAARERRGVERTWATLATAAVVTVAAHAVILSLYVEPIYTLAISLVLGLAMAGATGLSRSILPWRNT
jgi:hypothetical protein